MSSTNSFMDEDGEVFTTETYLAHENDRLPMINLNSDSRHREGSLVTISFAKADAAKIIALIAEAAS